MQVKAELNHANLLKTPPHRAHSLAAFVAAMVLVYPAFAEEGGAGHYTPGAMATLIDLPPTKPGWVIEPVYLHYQGNVEVSRPLPVAGLLAANLEATSDAALLGGFHTFKEPIAGAWYSLGLFVPYVWMDATATVTTPLGAVQRHDTEAGIGDVTLLPVMLGWKHKDWLFDAVLPIYAPTGQYETGRLANPGRNYWTFDPTLGVAYNGAKSGLNAAVHTGFSINTENEATDYQSGVAWHVEASVQQLLPIGPGFLGIGAEGFCYEQITGDSGSGATLGDLEGRTLGVGPVLSYVLPMKDNTLVFEARWLPELETKNRLEGDYFWVKLAYQF